jgi:competence protein ComEC
MMPRYISVFLCCYIFGVGIASLYLISENTVWLTLLGGMFLAVAILAMKKEIGIGLACIILGTGVGMYHVNLSFGANEYQEYLGQFVEMEGVIITDPVTSDKNQQVTLLPDGFTQYIRASLYTENPDAQKGDRVWIRGQLELPENFSGFDYIGYLQRWQVYAVLKKPRVIVIKRAKFSWRTPMLALREFVVNQAKVFPQSEGSLIMGMLIGQRQSIPEDVSKAFKTTGLTHIVAVSGFNMTVIATACGALVWYIGRRATNIMTIVIVFGFTIITGASAAVVRAAIMATIMVAAQLLGRQYASLYSLLLVASIMVFLNPRVVVWDIGFQLSVAATFGVLIAFRVKKPDTPNTFFGDLLRPTFGAIVMTAPIIALHFETFSVIAPLANMLVLPFVTWIMLFGALALIPIIGSVFVMPAQYLTSAVLYITQRLAKVPYASIDVHLPVWILIAYYIAVFIYIYSVLRKRPNNGKLQEIITNTL